MSDLLESVRERLATLAGHLRLTSTVSWPVVLIFVLATPLNQSFLLEGALADRLPIRLAISLVSSLAMFALLALIGRLTGKAKTPEPGLVIASVVVLSGLRAVLVTSAFEAIGAPTIPLSRVVALTVSSTLAVLVLTVIVDSVRIEVDQVNRLRALQDAIDTTRTDTAEMLRVERKATIGEVTRAVTAVVDQLPQIPREQAVDELREVAFGVVRPASHRLVATVPDIEVPESSVLEYRIELPEVTSEATQSGRIPINWYALTSVVILVGYGSVSERAGLALGPAIAAAAAQWVVGTLLNRLFAARIATKPAKTRGFLLTAELVLLGLTHSVVASVLFYPEDRTTRAIVASIIGSVTVGWLLLWATSLGRRHEATAEQTEAAQEQLQWEVARANAELRAQRRNVARLLHGPVQATINAAAIRLDRADGEKIDADLAVSVQASIRESLVKLLAGNYQERDLSLAIERIQGTWEGLCVIAVDDPQGVLELLQNDEPCASATTDIVTEACSDAVRHGQARHVWVSLSQQGNVVGVVITDDGANTANSGEPGLGSAFLEAVTVSWAREVGENGTTLTASVPFGPDREVATVP